MNAYLDGCLAEPATKALLVQSRTEAGLNDLVAARNESAATCSRPTWSRSAGLHAEPIAALLVAAVAEIALVELDAGRRDDELRDGLFRLATRTPISQIRSVRDASTHQPSRARRRSTHEALRQAAIKSFASKGFANVTATASAAKSTLANALFRPFRLNSAQHESERRLHDTPMALAKRPASDRSSTPARAVAASFAHDFEVVREGGDAGQHRVEAVTRGPDAGQRCRRSHSSWALVVLEQHRLPWSGSAGRRCAR